MSFLRSVAVMCRNIWCIVNRTAEDLSPLPGTGYRRLWGFGPDGGGHGQAACRRVRRCEESEQSVGRWKGFHLVLCVFETQQKWKQGSWRSEKENGRWEVLEDRRWRRQKMWELIPGLFSFSCEWRGCAAAAGSSNLVSGAAALTAARSERRLMGRIRQRNSI